MEIRTRLHLSAPTASPSRIGHRCLPYGSGDDRPFALAPAIAPDLPDIGGVTLRVARARYKEWDRCDLTYAELAGHGGRRACSPGTSAARARSIGPSGAVLGRARALVVNAGNSNAFTGYRGREAVEQMIAQVAQHLGCEPSDVFVASTGVIGVPLPQDKAEAGLAAAFAAEPCGWEEAAATIVTTDTFAKGAVTHGGRRRTHGHAGRDHQGIGHDRARHGDDARLHLHRRGGRPGLAATACRRANAKTFSCITVDSDTSTSDTVLAFATGTAGNAPLASSTIPAPMPSRRAR